MQRIPWALALMLGVLLTGCAGKFPLIGLGKDGEVKMAKVNQRKYVEHLSEGLVSVQESIVPALEAKEAGDQAWKLRTVSVGFAVKAEGGFGPFKVGLKPRVRVAFT